MKDSHLHAPSRTEFRWPPPQNDCGVWVGNQQQEVNADLSNKFFFRKLTGRCGETDAYMMNHSSVRILGQRHHRTNSLQNTDSQTILVWKIGAFDKITPHVMQLEMFAQIMQFNGVWCTYLRFFKVQGVRHQVHNNPHTYAKRSWNLSTKDWKPFTQYATPCLILCCIICVSPKCVLFLFRDLYFPSELLLG